MKREEQRYEEWLEKVRKNLPLVENPEELSEDIMQKISRIPRQLQKPVNWVRWFSAIAALFLFCTMMYEVLFYADTPTFERGTVTMNICPPTEIIQSVSLERMSEMTVRERTVFLSRIWKERREVQRRKENLINKLRDRNH